MTGYLRKAHNYYNDHLYNTFKDDPYLGYPDYFLDRMYQEVVREYRGVTGYTPRNQPLNYSAPRDLLADVNILTRGGKIVPLQQIADLVVLYALKEINAEQESM